MIIHFSLMAIFVVAFMFGFYYSAQVNSLMVIYRYELEKDGRVSGFRDFLMYLKTRMPQSLFASPSQVRESLSDESDTKDIKQILDKLYVLHTKQRIFFKICFTILVILFINNFFNSN